MPAESQGSQQLRFISGLLSRLNAAGIGVVR
ncbi:hypothetical protein GMOD_00005218 [Pyrenophora seminiperda CCB06]|uniref:Uncharacterized protein n=1 Tax=Pyrenophora seminiperda CCB06 TaxID=1302712 RepID=A0A3M7LVE4_9PLEO|nr:hypothetical protein GMOD_00005218 [Pyrenophora seminiperda CCB06]